MTMDFGFGFNNAVYCDRILRIEVTPDSLDSEGYCSPNSKSGRKDLDEKNVVEVKTLHISSLLVAANSPFFRKLFENGMKESHERDVTLRINASEEAALMDTLKFMHNNTLSANSDLVGVLIVADKFDVTSCIKYCSDNLQKIPMSLESSLLYLKLPQSVLVSESARPLIDAAKQYLVLRYSDFDKFQTELMDLPLCGVEAVLGGHGLQVDSEDNVFDFVTKWARRHYPKHEERQEILTKSMVRCLCFSRMSCSKLKEVVVSPDWGHEGVAKLVTDALFFKTQHIECNTLGRIYKFRPIKAVPMKFPQPRCVVYFDLRKEDIDCDTLNCLYSETFSLGGGQFYLMAKCYSGEEQESTFGLFLFRTSDTKILTIDLELAVMKMSSKEFQTRVKGKVTTTTSEGWGMRNLLGISFTQLTNKDCDYFIDEILHLRADITLIDCQD